MSHDALVFDFGGPVLLTPFELWPIGERALGLPPGTFAWPGPFDPAHDPEWQVFQAGGMNEREYWDLRVHQFAEITGEPPTMPAMCEYLFAGSVEELTRPAARRLIQDTKAAGIPMGLLTNDLTSFHDPDWLDAMTILREFEIIVDGRTEGVYKPEPAAYELILERMGISARGTVFIDDQPVNLAGAAAVGMTPVHCDPTNPGPAFDEVRALLGLPAAS